MATAAQLEISSGGEAVACRVEALRRHAGLPTRLQQLGVSASNLPELASDAAAEWTAQFNPRPVTHNELQTLYESAF